METKAKHAEIIAKMKLQILIRLLLVILSMIVILIRGAEDSQSPPFENFYLLMILVCILNLAYIFVLRKITNFEAFTLIQSILDVFWITTLIYLTGGVLSNFVSFYFFAILTSSMVANTKVSLITTSLSITGLCAVSLLYFITEHFQMELVGVHEIWIEENKYFGGNPNFILAYLLGQVISFILVTWLGSYLINSITQAKIVSEEILNSMAEGVVTFDKSNQLVFMNQKAKFLLGYPEEQNLLGISLDSFKKMNLDKPNGEFWRLFEKNERLTRELIVRNRKDSDTWIKLNISLISGAKGKIRGQVGVISDLTLVKKMEKAMSLANKLKGVEELAAGIAHEIRNPLSSIRGAIQELQEDFQDKNVLFNIALKESDRLNRIVSEFVNYAHVKRMKTTIVYLNDLLLEVVELLKFQHKHSQIEWILELKPALKIHGDEDQLRQMLLNLLSNSIETIESRGRIYIRAFYSSSEELLFTPQDGIQIEIEDNGTGLTEEEQKQMFIPFYTTKKGGTGIGLGIVYRIVKSHDGDIKVRSALGKGTTIVLWFPS